MLAFLVAGRLCGYRAGISTRFCSVFQLLIEASMDLVVSSL